MSPQSFDLKAFEQKAERSRKQLIKSGKLLTLVEMRERLAMTQHELRRAQSTHQLFAVDVGGVQYYPAFYLCDKLDRREFEKVNQSLGDLPGWSRWQFFTTPKASLNNLTPLAALQQGMSVEVEDAAHAFAER